MDTEIKPGWRTSQFWLSAVVTVLVIPILAWLGSETTSPLGDMLQALGGVSPVLAVIVVAVKVPLFGFLGWCAKKLATAYGADRTTLYIHAMGIDSTGRGKAA